MTTPDSMTVFQEYLTRAFPGAEVSREDFPVLPTEGRRGFAIDEGGRRRVVLVTEPFWADSSPVGLHQMLDLVGLKREIERHEHVVVDRVSGSGESVIQVRPTHLRRPS